MKTKERAKNLSDIDFIRKQVFDNYDSSRRLHEYANLPGDESAKKVIKKLASEAYRDAETNADIVSNRKIKK